MTTIATAAPIPPGTYESPPMPADDAGPVPPGSPPSQPVGGVRGWIQNLPEGVRIGIVTTLGLGVGGAVGMLLGPVGGAVGAALGGLFAFSFAKALTIG